MIGCKRCGDCPRECDGVRGGSLLWHCVRGYLIRPPRPFCLGLIGLVNNMHKAKLSAVFTMYRWPWQLWCWFWASPASIVGLIAGAVGLCTGGKVRRIGPTLEFWGGAVTGLMQSRLIHARGMTLGHVILGVSETALESVRPHEWVHVRQYERWGPLFLPAYLLCSAVLWLCGRNPYWENPFEVEAYEADIRRE